MVNKHLKWLKSKKGYLKIIQIENDLKMPPGTLRKYIDDERTLAEHWIPKVIQWVIDFKK